MTTAKVDFKGYHLHGKTLPVVGRRYFHGVPMVVVLFDGVRYGLPAANVQVLGAQAKESPDFGPLFAGSAAE